MKNKINNVDYSNAELTNRGKIFMQWLEMTIDDGKDQSFKEIREEFEEYYQSLFNPKV